MTRDQMLDVLTQMAEEWTDNQPNTIKTGAYTIKMVVKVNEDTIQISNADITFDTL